MTLRRGMAFLLALSLGLMGLGPVEALTPDREAALFVGCPSPVTVNARCPSLNFDFVANQAWAQGQYYPISKLLTVTRSQTNASTTNLMPWSPSGFAFSTFAANTLRETTGLGIIPGEDSRTNQLFNSTAPATQTTPSLATGTYTLTAYGGSGSLAMSAGSSGSPATGCGTGTATLGNPVTVVISGAGTCDVTVSGSLECEQLELGSFGTSCIVTANAVGVRGTEVARPSGAATALMLGAHSAYFQTNHVALLANSPRLYSITAGNPSINYGTTTTVTILNSSTAGPVATLGQGDISGLVTTSFGFDASGIIAVANSGLQATSAAAWDGTSGSPVLGNIAAGSRALNGYMLRASFSPTKSALALAANPIPAGSGTIAAWGDSLTQGNGSTAGNDYLTVVANALRRIQVNGGLAGQTSQQIVARQGGTPDQITLTSNQIPASGAATVTAFSQDVCFYGGAHNACSFTGSLSGIPGTLAGDVSGNYTFTRTSSGSVVQSPANAPFIMDLATQNIAKLQILEMGRNNFNSPSQVEADYASANAYKTYAAFDLSVLTAETEGIGTPNYIAITALNSALASTYGAYFIDVTSPPTTAEMAALNFAPNAQDLTDIANGVIPTGMRAGDLLHLNNTGYALWAMRIESAILAQHL